MSAKRRASNDGAPTPRDPKGRTETCHADDAKTPRDRWAHSRLGLDAFKMAGLPEKARYPKGRDEFNKARKGEIKHSTPVVGVGPQRPNSRRPRPSCQGAKIPTREGPKCRNQEGRDQDRGKSADAAKRGAPIPEGRRIQDRQNSPKQSGIQKALTNSRCHEMRSPDRARTTTA
jgi:hypothetical protein